MLVIKNNTFILKGKRNKLDGLWNITIPKRKITANCCVSPIKHGSIYKRKPHEVSNVTRNTTSKQYKTTTFPSHLHNLQALAISNDFDNAIDEELKLRVQTPSPQPTTLRANIILQKKQTHMQLVTYLHACCFSPVKSTFKKSDYKGFSENTPRFNSATSRQISPTKCRHCKRTFEPGETTSPKYESNRTKKPASNR